MNGNGKELDARADKKNIAISGYDPVAYFEAEKAIPGVSDYQVEYEGELWFFSSLSNQERFEASPATYTPQYGGFCSWAMAKGNRVDVDPECFVIDNGKLYLNFSKRIHKRWQRRMRQLIAKADMQWASQNKGSR